MNQLPPRGKQDIAYSCPYLAAADIVVADTTCDGKKKMYELLAPYKPVALLQLPEIQDSDALSYWRKQFEGLVHRLEQEFGVSITNAKLHEAIALMNRERLALKAVMDLAQRSPSPVTGVELVEIAFKTSFFPDKEMGRLADEGQAACNSEAPRILLTGVPVGLGSHKVVRLIEECGGSVVCLDNCSAYKKNPRHDGKKQRPADRNGKTLSGRALRRHVAQSAQVRGLAADGDGFFGRCRGGPYMAGLPDLCR